MKTKISMIAALGENRVLGKENKLPWHLPDDLKWLKEKTKSKPIFLGRTTFASIGYRPLPHRPHYVLTRQTDVSWPDVTVVHSLEETLSLIGDEPELMVLGGGQVYEHYLPQADRLYLTLIDAAPEGDAFFPEWRNDFEWKEVYREAHPVDEKHAFSFTFLILDRVWP